MSEGEGTKPPPDALAVDLADGVRDFDGTLARVLSHLDLPQDEAFARFHGSFPA